jgi:RimJ/RimL family protein N-acetyltransferase
VTNEPVIRTERLLLRPQQASDLEGLVELIASEETRKHLGSAKAEPAQQFERLLRNAGSWRLYGYGAFAVRRQDDPELIGSCGVFHSWRGFGEGMDDVPEAGWIIRSDACGQGVASEAMEAIFRWFDTKFGPRRVACMIEMGNAASERLAKKLGFIA